jgi:hypothetical protein
LNPRGLGNLLTPLIDGGSPVSGSAAPDVAGRKAGTSAVIGRCSSLCPDASEIGAGPPSEGTMATTRERRQIVETPTEARQAEPGPSVFALLMVSTGLAILILGAIWFVFFHA